MTNRCLEGITVIDLGQIYSGPYCTLLLAHLGANVIKIEPPGGEHLRRRAANFGASIPFVMLNSNKRCVTLNLKTEQGKALFLRMVERADVVVENFMPGVMDRLGLSYDRIRAVNPRIIYAHASGYGRTGPYARYPAMDITVQAMTGIVATTGFPDGKPVKAGPAVADFMAGIHLFAGVLAALLFRGRAGEGCLVDVSMMESVLPSLLSSIGAFMAGLPIRVGNRHNGLTVAPYNIYPTADGDVAIFCVSDEHWEALLGVMGRADLKGDPRYKDMSTRARHMQEVDDLIEAWTKGRSRDEVFRVLTEAGVPCAPVRGLDEVLEDEHLLQRGMLVPIHHPSKGPVKVLGSPIHFDPSAEVTVRPAAELGQHNEEVYCSWLGMSRAELAELARQGVV